ncbi:MAG: bifunctional phosphoribosylaminoimidazolecarboxamide formyltransferase/IMP cyclohydrolase [Bacteroidota bacterium]|nr:bifunctional phosphoribosylaminoimidazolecarboxamide formyltransferase/IMP cyclohydrolase [Bacteroidota bacterium]
MIKRALLSVYDKTGIVEFAKELLKFNVEIISTGGTYKLLKENNIEVKTVEEVTGFPEILNGRLKTLHPNIFAGILCDRDIESHFSELKKHNINPIDLIVVNLYPFEKTISQENVKVADAIEQIDIGGVSLIRAAAKNYKDVNVLVAPEQYKEFTELLNSSKNSIPSEHSQKLAQLAFKTTSSYDSSIQKYFASPLTPLPKEGNSKLIFKEENIIPDLSSLEELPPQELRYGENPHQRAVLLKENFDEIFEVLHGKVLSYNNLLDIDAGYNLISEFETEKVACAIIKHGNPSGVAVAEDLSSAYAKAFATDTLSPFGGIIIFNKKLDFKTSIDIDKLFSEIILAPGFDDNALELLKKKKNRRLVKFKFTKDNFEFRKIAGGILYQDKNNLEVKKEDIKFVTKRKATDEEVEDMLFAFKVVKHTKSNAIVFVKEKRTLAIGGGQPSRIDSTKIAISKSNEFNQELNNSVAASDAFFPFADGLTAIAKAGASAIIQPGGSVRDDEVIKAADDFNIAMAFTGIRHFKH